MFFTFLLLLLAGAVVPVVIFSTVEAFGLGGLTPMSLAAGQRPSRRAAFGAWSAAQAYIWLGWAAYCASLGLGYSLKPTSGGPWVYLVASLFATAVPIAYLRVKDRLTSGSDEEQRQLLRGSNFWRVVVLSACVCFWIAPQLISRPYGWLSPVAPKVLVGVHPSVDVAVGAAPSRTIIVAPSSRTPDPWQSPVAAAGARPSLGRTTDTDRAITRDNPPCGAATTADRDRDDPDAVPGARDECASDRMNRVGADD